MYRTKNYNNNKIDFIVVKSKKELEDNFHWWITCIPDKINLLKRIIPKYLSDKLDYSLASLNEVGKYLLENKIISNYKK